MNVPWLTIAGFGAHIKSTPRLLIIQKNGQVEEYPIREIGHLLLIGGHTLHTSTIMHLIESGAAITLFDSDGKPVAAIRPYGPQPGDRYREIQAHTPKHSYAVTFAKAALRSRMLFINQLKEDLDKEILYQGETEFLHKAQDELEFLIKLDEVRRLHQLTENMYYEIIARVVPPDLGFRRRTRRPYRDPVNSMLSFGYAMLYGNCLTAVLGAGLDPDDGMLHRGRGSLVYDLIGSWKHTVVDGPIIELLRSYELDSEYEISETRCILSDGLMKILINTFHSQINRLSIDEMVLQFRESLERSGQFDWNFLIGTKTS